MKKPVQGVSRETLAQNLSAAVDAMPLALSSKQHEMLLDYVMLLLKWNAVYNLTAVRIAEDMLRLHIIDCMAVQAPMRQALADQPSPRVLDIGAGAGLPGIVLAILNPTWNITLIDAVQKKVAFMTQAIAQLKLSNAVAVHGRIEDLQNPAFDAVVSRAFADLDLFVKLAVPHLSASGRLFAMQGKADDRLLQPFQSKSLHRLRVPGLDAERHLLILDHLKD